MYHVYQLEIFTCTVYIVDFLIQNSMEEVKRIAGSRPLCFPSCLS